MTLLSGVFARTNPFKVSQSATKVLTKTSFTSIGDYAFSCQVVARLSFIVEENLPLNDSQLLPVVVRYFLFKIIDL